MNNLLLESTYLKLQILKPRSCTKILFSLVLDLKIHYIFANSIVSIKKENGINHKTYFSREAENLFEMLPKEEKNLGKLDWVLIQNLRKIKQNQFHDFDFEAFEIYSKSEMFLSQFNMALAQNGLFTSLVASPRFRGLHDQPK